MNKLKPKEISILDDPEKLLRSSKNPCPNP